MTEKGLTGERKMKTAVLIPCYNESLTIAKVVGDFRRELPEAEICVYDNNSTDGSAELALKAGAVVRKVTQQGKGSVVRRMFREIDADCFVMVDADDTYPAEAVHELLKPVVSGIADMVNGDRLSSTYMEENKRKGHGFGNLLVRWLIRVLWRRRVNDVMTGYRAFSRYFVKSCPILSNGFEVETEMTIHTIDKRLALVEIPIEYRDRPRDSKSKLNTVSDGIRVLHTIGWLFKLYRPEFFYNSLPAVFAVTGAAMSVPVFMTYFETGSVPRFPTLIVAGFMELTAILLVIVGQVLSAQKNRFDQLFEIVGYGCGHTDVGREIYCT